MKQHTIYISLGTNEGNKLKNLQKAIDLINVKVGCVQQIASVYKTPSLGFQGNDFYNTCIEIKTYFSSEKVMQILLSIEAEMGRVRTQRGYADRIIDLDILLFDNDIIATKNVTVPHLRMLGRKFVLVPLNDIAKNVIHPQEKSTIQNCLYRCTDLSEITKIKKMLKKPTSITERYNYIAIEGNIGAGKTSLTNMLSDDFNAKKVLERFAENPFLPKFYNDKERFAFPLEMSFLVDRYRQLSDDLAQFDLFKNIIISDYYIFKSLIFAQITLSEEEYRLYRRIFDIMYSKITKPDLYIYLHQGTDILLQNIKKRGRDYEKNIETTYLQKIHRGYSSFIKTQPRLNTLIIDISELDFVKKPNDYQFIINTIKTKN